MKISEFLEAYSTDLDMYREENEPWDSQEELKHHDDFVLKLEAAIEWQKTYEQHAKDYGVKVYGEDVV